MNSLSALFAVSEAGLALERQRLEVAATNIANAYATRGPDGALYRPLRVVVSTPADGDFSAYLLGGLSALAPRSSLVAVDAAPKRVLDPGHPHADAAGFVEMPGVNATVEMIQIMTAVRAYEANLKAIAALRTMTSRALEIGGGR